MAEMTVMNGKECAHALPTADDFRQPRVSAVGQAKAFQLLQQQQRREREEG